jgi:hypothetical protein
MAFDEVGYVAKQQARISSTVAEVNKNNKSMNKQVSVVVLFPVVQNELLIMLVDRRL